MREKTRKLALCGMLCALAAVFLLLGSVIPAALYCCPILAMAALLPVREEFGTKLALTAYAAVAILGLLLAADRELAGVWLFWGWYPAVQPTLDRIRPRALQYGAKLGLCTASMAALYALLIFLFQMEALVQEFRTTSAVLMAATVVLMELVFLLTGAMLHRLSALWRNRLRRRWLR